MKNKLCYFIVILFGAIYAPISLVNHYMFRTYSLDLGLFNHALYSFAHLKMDNITLMWNANYLGDHFSPIMILLSPLYYFKSTYVLLIVQIAAILWGGMGVYKYTSERTDLPYLPHIILVFFYSLWGIFAALSFDFHTNILAAMIVPWFIYYLEKGNKKTTIILFVLALLTKENISFWFAFILIGMAFKNRFQLLKTMPVFLIVLFGVSVSYFLIVVGYVMPYLANATYTNQMLWFASFGKTFPEIILNMITHPVHLFEVVFSNTTHELIYENVKTNLLIVLLFSGGLALIIRPIYLIMLIPIFAQKLLSFNPSMWSIWLQYSIEFVPILSLALFDTLLLLKQPKLRYSIALISVALAIHINIFEMDNSDYPYHKLGNRQRLRFYNEEHYQQDFLVKEIHEALKLIPAKGIVSAHGNLGPHLAFRDTILLYPNITNADYIAIFRDTKGVGTWPLNLEDYNRKLIELDSSNSYQRIYDKKSLVIFRRK